MSSAPDAPESSRTREEAEQEPELEPRRKWVALVSVVHFPANEDDERAQQIARGHDVLLDLDNLPAPPLPTYLVLHPRVAPDPRRNNGPLSAYILAADPSGFILLQAMEGNIPDFFLCNTHTSTVTIIPPVSSNIKHKKGLDIAPLLSIGLITDYSGDFIVAQLHPTTSKDYPVGVLCYSTATESWSTRYLTLIGKFGCPPANPFSETGVIAHDGYLWWISLAYGVFFYDPFTPLGFPCHLFFVPLPPGCAMEDRKEGFDLRIRTLLDQRRCVRLSNGKLRFVEIRGLSYDVDAAPAANPTVWMWTLVNPKGVDAERCWTLEYEVAFAEIWDSESYGDAGLQREVPHVAFVDPHDHHVVYFLQDSKLFSVDMREKKVICSFAECFQAFAKCLGRSAPMDVIPVVVNCKDCLIDRDQLQFRSSRPIVDAWEVPAPHDDSSPDALLWSDWSELQSYVERKKLEVTPSVGSSLNQAPLEWVENMRALEEMAPAAAAADEMILAALPTFDESSVNSGGQAADEPEIQTPLLQGETERPVPKFGCGSLFRSCVSDA